MTSKTESKPALEDATDLVIAVLYAKGKSGKFNEPIDGITRLQKLVFLLQNGYGPKELVSEAKRYGYEPYKMGPFAEGLQNDLNDLLAAGIVLTRRLEYWLPDDTDASPRGTFGMRTKTKQVESMRYYLSELGEEIGKDLWAQLDSGYRSELVEFKTFFNALTLRQLLIFTYEKFPKFTSESII